MQRKPAEANKDVLLEFLNMILEDKNIEHVDFIPNEHLGLTEDDRKVIFDISARDTFVKAKAAGEKNAKFDWDYNLKPVTVVAVLNFSFKH